MLWARCLSISCRRSALRVCSVHVASSVATAMSGTVRTSSLVPIRQLGITGSPRGEWLHRDAIFLQVGSIVLGGQSGVITLVMPIATARSAEIVSDRLRH